MATWSEIFELQDQIAERVVGAVAPAVEEAEISRARRKVGNLEAYDHYLRGLAAMREYTQDSRPRARALLDKAVALDPDLAIAWAIQVSLCVSAKSMAWDADAVGNEARAELASRTALRIDRNDARVLAICGHALAYVCGRYEEGRALLEEAVRLDPNHALGWTWRGTAYNRIGEPERALADLERAIRLSPRDANMFLAHGQVAAAHFIIGHYDEAVQWAESSLRLLPNHVTALRILTASLSLAGRAEAAAKSLGCLSAARSRHADLNAFQAARDCACANGGEVRRRLAPRWHARMTEQRRLAAIVSADVAGYSQADGPRRGRHTGSAESPSAGDDRPGDRPPWRARRQDHR